MPEPDSQPTVDELVVSGLAQEGAELRERVVSLGADVLTYRELAVAGIHACHALTMERDRLRVSRDRLIVENRELRAALGQERAA